VNFLENFVNARNVGTPLVKINTPDAASTIANVRKALGKDQTKIPLASWDAITGLNGINDAGTEAVAKMLSAAGVEKEATVVLPVTLQAIRNPQHADFICFIHNEHPIAAIISRETGNRELLEALDNAILIFGNDQHSGPKFFNGENSAYAQLTEGAA